MLSGQEKTRVRFLKMGRKKKNGKDLHQVTHVMGNNKRIPIPKKIWTPNETSPVNRKSSRANHLIQPSPPICNLV